MRIRMEYPCPRKVAVRPALRTVSRASVHADPAGEAHAARTCSDAFLRNASKRSTLPRTPWSFEYSWTTSQPSADLGDRHVHTARERLSNRLEAGTHSLRRRQPPTTTGAPACRVNAPELLLPPQAAPGTQSRGDAARHVATAPSTSRSTWRLRSRGASERKRNCRATQLGDCSTRSEVLQDAEGRPWDQAWALQKAIEFHSACSEQFALLNKPKNLKDTRADWDRDVQVWVKLARACASSWTQEQDQP